MSDSKLDKKQLLLTAAMDLFAQQGFWNSSTAAIAKHAKVATGTLFNYFDSKDDLIDEVYMQLKHDLMAALMHNMPSHPEKAVEHTWYQYITWVLNNPQRHDLLNQLKVSNSVSHQAKESAYKQFSALQALFIQLIEQGHIKPLTIGYFNEIFVAQMEASASYAKQQSLTGLDLAKHLTLGFEAFWQGVGQTP